MGKKHWIYIKRGLSEDPKHRARMGECVWLYMHIIDRADWETGIAYEWRDQEEAAEMGMPLDTLRRQRQKLEESSYITCQQKQHAQDITILEWRNPRDYGSEIKNRRSQDGHETPPSNQDDNSQGLNQGLNQVQAQVQTPTLDSESKSLRDTQFGIIANELSTLCGGALNSMTADLINTWMEKHLDSWIIKAIGIAKEKHARSAKYVDEILIGWEVNGYPKPRTQRVADYKTPIQSRQAANAAALAAMNFDDKGNLI